MRRRRGTTEHPTFSGQEKQNLTEGAAPMLEKLNELEQRESAPKVRPTVDLKNLALLGRITEDVEVGGYTFKLATLSNSQWHDVMTAIMKMRPEERGSSLAPLTLAISILSVNEVPLKELYDGNDNLTDLEKNLFVIDSFQSELVDFLKVKYDSMLERSKRCYSGDTVGEQVKN